MSHCAVRIVTVLAAVVTAIFCCAGESMAQQIEMASSPNPVGSGARAIGMGGAFIAVADDATAASWNPGGLIQLERPEVSLVGSYYLREEEYTSGLHPETEGDNEMTSTNLNYLSAAYPFALFGRNMVASLNYQHLYDFNKEIELEFDWPLTAGTLYDHVAYEQDGGLWAISPALALQISPSFSVGLALNFWEDFLEENRWTTNYRSVGTGDIRGKPVDILLHVDNEFSFSGFNMNIGFLWDINEMFSVGGVFKTAFDADVRRKTRYSEFRVMPGLPPEFSTSSQKESVEHLDLEMPRSYGLGMAIRFSDAFTVDLDVYRTEWGRFAIVAEDDDRTSPVTGRPKETSDVGSTTQVRIGAEYLFIRENTIIPLRAGIFYDPEPADHSPEDYYGFSVGSGLIWKSLLLDAAYQFRWGDGVEGDVIGVPGTDADVRQHLVIASAIVHF